MSRDTEWLIRHIYPEDLQSYYRENFVALQAFVSSRGVFPSQYDERGKKYDPDHPERKLAIFVKVAKQQQGTNPSLRQLMELVPGWN